MPDYDYTAITDGTDVQSIAGLEHPDIRGQFAEGDEMVLQIRVGAPVVGDVLAWITDQLHAQGFAEEFRVESYPTYLYIYARATFWPAFAVVAAVLLAVLALITFISWNFYKMTAAVRDTTDSLKTGGADLARDLGTTIGTAFGTGTNQAEGALIRIGAAIVLAIVLVRFVGGGR